MRFEIPDCRRCCLCVPLRYGILIFGYLNLIFSLFVLSLELWLEFGHVHGQTSYSMFVFRGVSMYTHVWFPFLMYVLEVIFNIVLLIGAHRKDVRIMRAYYYYGVVTTLAVFLTFIVVRRYSLWPDWFSPEPLEICFVISGLGLQCYLLLLIRTELKKVRYQEGQFRYVNHMAEVVVDPTPPGQEGNSL